MSAAIEERIVSPWVQTWTGRAVDLDDPRPEQINRTDIARSLERLVRFNGHTTVPYTVAQHSVLVMQLTTLSLPSLRLAALLHDAHEAYMGDIASPVASLPGMADPIAALKARLQRAIHLRFGLPEMLPEPWRRAIAAADLDALAIEKRDLMAPEPRPWGLPPRDLPDGDVRVMLEAGLLNGFRDLLGALS